MTRKSEKYTDLRHRTGKKPSVPRYYPIDVKRKPKRRPHIPKFANWGFTFYHPSIKVLIFSVFLAFVSLTTPFWAYVDEGSFGLWMYCSSMECTSIHDNLVPDRSVPAWYHLTQGSFCIGTVASLVALGILVNNVYSTELKMTQTVYTMALCVLGISVMQMTVSLYTFTTYFHHTNFLYHIVDYNDQLIDYHGSFYCGLISTILTAVTAIILLLDDDITKASKVKQYLMQASRRDSNHDLDRDLDPVMLQALQDEYIRLQNATKTTTKNYQIPNAHSTGLPEASDKFLTNQNLSMLSDEYSDAGGFPEVSGEFYDDPPPPYTADNPAPPYAADNPAFTGDTPYRAGSSMFTDYNDDVADTNAGYDYDAFNKQDYPYVQKECVQVLSDMCNNKNQPDPEMSYGSKPDPEMSFNFKPDPEMYYGSKPDPEISFNSKPDPQMSFNSKPDPEMYFNSKPDPDKSYSSKPDPEKSFSSKPDPQMSFNSKPDPEMYFNSKPDPEKSYGSKPDTEKSYGSKRGVSRIKEL